MILGMAARSSMAMPIGPFRKLGAISVTKIAMPMAIGTAMRMDRRVVTAVPNIAVAAPKDSLTGFQSVELRNLKTPNLDMERDDSRKSTTSIPIIRRSTMNDAAPVIREKEKSKGFFFCKTGNSRSLSKLFVY
jgi:hypothetical protein